MFTATTGKNEHTFKFAGPISALAFSENGLWLAVAVKGSPIVEIVTLSKMNTVHSLDFGDPIGSLEWDYTGQYLAAGGPGSLNVHAYDRAAKTWSKPLKKVMNVVNIHWVSVIPCNVFLHTSHVCAARKQLLVRTRATTVHRCIFSPFLNRSGPVLPVVREPSRS